MSAWATMPASLPFSTTGSRRAWWRALLEPRILVAIVFLSPRAQALVASRSCRSSWARVFLPPMGVKEGVLVLGARLDIAPRALEHVPARLDQALRMGDGVPIERVRGHGDILVGRDCCRSREVIPRLRLRRVGPDREVDRPSGRRPIRSSLPVWAVAFPAMSGAPPAQAASQGHVQVPGTGTWPCGTVGVGPRSGEVVTLLSRCLTPDRV
jgi:hypothetical protein